jgi:hypothetical protein
MVWTVLGAIALVIAIVASQMVLEATVGLSTGLFAWLFARGIGQFAATMENKGFNDPVYKKNLQRLIERNREFEEARSDPALPGRRRR